MLETSKEIRQKKLRERADGILFPFTENKYFKAIELLVVPIAFCMRIFPFVRKSIGADTCKVSTTLFAFVWYQLWVAASIGITNTYFIIFSNPFTLGSWEATLLSFLSFHMVIRVLVIKAVAFQKSAIKNEDTDSSNRGESHFFDIAAGKLFGKKWAKQLLLEPACFALLGFLLLSISGFEHAGLFFLIGSLMHLIDETSYHTAKGIIAENERKAKKEAEKKAEFHEERDF